MLLSVLEKVNSFNEFIFAPIDNLVEKLPFADWVVDALCDSIHLIPFLFFVFLLIEILEFYYADKINSMLKNQGKYAVPIGALAALFPQCGISVIASSLYVGRVITRGTLIAVYLATSDETIPILLATPLKAHLLVPIVGIKLFIGIVVGFLVEILMPTKTDNDAVMNFDDSSIMEEGCCKHDIEHGHKRELIVHPIMHTINIWGFILVVTLILNYCLNSVAITECISGHEMLQPLWAALVGLVPNCAISVGLTMMLIKGSISFGAVMSGLLANAGLGLLVLFKNNDFKDTLKILFILFVVSVISGVMINIIL